MDRLKQSRRLAKSGIKPTREREREKKKGGGGAEDELKSIKERHQERRLINIDERKREADTYR